MPHLDTRTDLDIARMSGTFAGVKTSILDYYNSNDLEYRGWYSDKVTDWTTKESWFSYQQGREFSKASRPALEPTQSPVHWIQGSFL